MNGARQLTLHFNHSTTMAVSFPTRVNNSAATVLEGIQRILQADQPAIQTDAQIVVVPGSSLKSLQAASVPATGLRFGAIKGARIITASETTDDRPPTTHNGTPNPFPTVRTPSSKSNVARPCNRGLVVPNASISPEICVAVIAFAIGSF